MAQERRLVPVTPPADKGGAILGVFVVNQDGALYGVCAGHFVTHAGGLLYCCTNSQDPVPLGTTSTESVQSRNCLIDIGTFLICNEMRFKCETAFRNIHGRICESRLYTGTSKMLTGKEIFLRTSILETSLPDLISRGLMDHMVLEGRPDDSGYVHVVKKIFGASLKDQLKYKKMLLQGVGPIENDFDDFSFIAQSYDGTVVEGDSGATAFLQNADGSVELVGILAGRIEEEGSTTYLHFTFLKSLLDGTGNGSMSPEFRLATERDMKTTPVEKEGGDTNFFHVRPGSTIILKKFYHCTSPEEIEKLDFNLMEKMSLLVSGLGLYERGETASEMSQESEFERKLQKWVHGGEAIETALFTEDSPDQACFYLCMKGCKAIYANDFQTGISHLKDAYRAVLNASNIYRLFAKIVQLLSLAWLHSDAFTEMEELFDMAVGFMESIDTKEKGSASINGYFYMNFLRLFDMLNDQEKFMKYGKRCIDLFDYYDKVRGITSQGPGLARVLLARILLKCGCYFETTDKPLSDGDLQTANSLLQDINWDISSLPILRANYKLAMAEVLFRDGRYSEALSAAQYSYNTSVKHGLGVWIKQSEAHIAALEKLCRVDK